MPKIVQPSKIALILIVILAFFLRAIDIEGNPKSMYGDELTLVYDAYSILKTGQDQKGNFLPLFFEMGGGRPAGYIYATIPFVAIFGPTATAARTVSVLSGVGVVVLMYLISSNLISKYIGILAALVASLTPWELNLSRGAFESHFALFLALVGLYLFLFSFKKTKFLLLSAIFFAFSMQTYSTYTFTVPIFFALLIYLFKDKIAKSFSYTYLFPALLIVGLSLAFSLFTSFNRGAKDRFTNLFIMNEPALNAVISEKVSRERLFSPLHPEFARKVHNKYIEFTASFVGNYVRNFGLDFLIIEGDRNPRHNPALMGQLLWVGLPFFILGFMFIFQKHKKLLPFLLGWLLIAPIPAALTGHPHAIRSSFMLPPLVILIAAGVYCLVIQKSFVARSFMVLLLFLFLFELPLFYYRLYMLAPALNSSFWSYSAKKATLESFKNREKYEHIIISTSIPDTEFAYPVYNKIEPAEVLYQAGRKTYLGEHEFMKLGNIYLGSIPSGRIRKIMNSLQGSVLYLGTISDRGMVDNEKIIREIDDTPLYLISTKE